MASFYSFGAAQALRHHNAITTPQRLHNTTGGTANSLIPLYSWLNAAKIVKMLWRPIALGPSEA